MKYVSTNAGLNRALKQHLNSVMSNQVAEEIKNEQSQQVHKQVYNKYRPNADGEPYVYKRRGDEGGLSDTENMDEDTQFTVNGVELTVTNNTRGKDGKTDVSGLVEKGHDNGFGEYDYTRNRSGDAYKYLEARPYLEKTIEELNTNKKHIKSAKKALRSMGLDVF